MSKFERHKFVFICGVHRSGTSLLFKCLRDHPEISGFEETGVPEDEGQHLQTVFKPASAYGGWGQFGLNKNAYLDERSPLVCDRNREKLLSEWQSFWDMEQPILLEKSPPNLIRMRFLQAMFPNSYFIVLKRHPIAVSYATQKVSKKGLYSLIEHWLVCYEAAIADLEKLDNVMTLRYEDFVNSPNKTLSEIYQFLNVAFSATDEEIRSNVNEKYLQRWEEREQNWLLKKYGGMMENRLESRVNQLGYSLVDIRK